MQPWIFCETKCCFCNIVLGNLVCCSFLSASLSRIGLVAGQCRRFHCTRCSDLDWILSWIVVQTPIFTTRQSTRFITPPKKEKRTFPTWRGRPCTDYALLQLVPAVCDLRPGLLDLPPLGFLNRPLHKEHWTLSPRKFKSLKKRLDSQAPSTVNHWDSSLFSLYKPSFPTIVDERNPAPVDVGIPLFTRLYTSQVPQDSFHQH